ncbi:hypothetical protein BKA70DRAFT_1318487, partial [Coprinopsis sp. MPI-PUGE-AT-0042]
MRRSQTVRTYGRNSLALASDELGALREAGETDEDVLRRQLLEKDRLVDELTAQIESLSQALMQRPPAEELAEMRKDAKAVDILLQGTQRENERCMAELEKAKTREKLLESKLRDLAGENWATALDIPPSSGLSSFGGPRGMLGGGHQRSATISHGSPGPPSRGSSSPLFNGHRRNTSFSQSQEESGILADMPGTIGSRRRPSESGGNSLASSTATMRASPQQEAEHRDSQRLAHLEQIKMLVLGMDQRLQVREGALAKSLEKAEKETKRLEGLRQELGGSGAVA